MSVPSYHNTAMWATFAYLMGVLVSLLIVLITGHLKRNAELRDAQIGIPKRLADGQLYYAVPEAQYNQLFRQSMSQSRYDEDEGDENPRSWRTDPEPLTTLQPR